MDAHMPNRTSATTNPHLPPRAPNGGRIARERGILGVVLLALTMTAACEVEEGSGGACDSLSTCTGGDVCVDAICVAAFPRVYSFSVVGASIPQVDPATNEAWDILDGAPDPYAEIYVNDELVHTTAEVADTLTPQWNSSTDPITLRAGDAVSIYVLDSDVDDSDYVGACVVDPITAETIRDVTLGCGGAFGTIDWSIVPL